jgi:DNA-binding NtrC family response regulator
VLREIAQAARTSMPVLLTGETGSRWAKVHRLCQGRSSRESGFASGRSSDGDSHHLLSPSMQ